MKNDSSEIKRLTSKDADLLGKFSKNAAIKAYLKSCGKNEATLTSLIGHKPAADQGVWVCLHGGKPQALLIAQELSEHSHEQISQWIEQDKQTLWVDFLPLGKEEASPEVMAQWLRHLTASCAKSVQILFIAPEVKEEAILAACEQAGFNKVGSFIKGQGFFKGTPHYLLKHTR